MSPKMAEWYVLAYVMSICYRPKAAFLVEASKRSSISRTMRPTMVRWRLIARFSSWGLINFSSTATLMVCGPLTAFFLCEQIHG